MTINVERK